MGLCNSSLSPEEAHLALSERQLSSKIDSKTHKAQKIDALTKKLLFLGAGESGKSTLYKQLVSLYGEGFSPEVLAQHRHTVHQNVVESMQMLVEKLQEYSAKAADAPDDADLQACVFEATPEITAALSCVQDLNPSSPFDMETAKACATLWAMPAIQTVYKMRAGFQLVDSAAYFLSKVMELAEAGYTPSYPDYLRTRVRTTGVVDTHFEIENNSFVVFDVGGQRSERRKWLHCFEGVTAVLFVAALSEYDQSLFEDGSVNRMDEALALFDDTCNSRWFRTTSIVLFLNKKDLFEEKIQQVPLKSCFPAYAGPSVQENPDVPLDDVVAAGIDFIKLEFESLCQYRSKEIYVHVTTAVDTQLVDKVFTTVKDIIVRSSLAESGLIHM